MCYKALIFTRLTYAPEVINLWAICQSCWNVLIGEGFSSSGEDVFGIFYGIIIAF